MAETQFGRLKHLGDNAPWHDVEPVYGHYVASLCGVTDHDRWWEMRENAALPPDPRLCKRCERIAKSRKEKAGAD